MIDFHKQLSIIPEVYETAELQDNLEHSGGISISWKSATDTEIPMGSYVKYPLPAAGQTEAEAGTLRYLLMQPYAPTKQGVTHFKYDPQFKHPQAMLDFTPFWIKSLDSEGKPIFLRTTSYTGFPYIIAQLLCDFFNEYVQVMSDTFFRDTVGTDWMYNIQVAVDSEGRVIDPHTIITVSFDGSSIKAAADAIADAMGCNVFFDWNLTEYEFKDEQGNTYTKMCRTIKFVAGTTIQGESYNCFHVLGGTTNMGKNTASGSFAAITQRLTLRTEADDEHTHEGVDYFPGSIIKTGAALEQGGLMLIKDLILDDIYPKMELYVCYAHQRLCYLTDNDTGEFIVDHWENENGQTVPMGMIGAKPVYKTFAKWYVRLSVDAPVWDEEKKKWTWETPYKFNQSLLIDDKPLSLLFQMDYRDPEHMSKLVGRQFELTYFPDKVTEWDKTDEVDHDHAYKTYSNGKDEQGEDIPDADPTKISEFRIAFVAEGDTILPTTSMESGGEQFGLIPQIGDKVTLVNVSLTAEKGRAQDELLAAAQEIISLIQTPAGEYTETVIFGKNVNGRTIDRLSIGQDSPFGSAHGPVVTNISHNLDTDVAEVTVGSWTRKTRSGGTADKLETVTVSANSSTEGGTAYSDGSIGSGGGYGGYGGNSVETYENTTLKPESMFVAGLSNTIDAVACDTDGKVKQATDVYTKITALAGVKDVTSACTVAVKALPPVQVVSAGTNITVKLYVTDRDEDETLIVDPETKNSYDLSQDKRWLRLHFPQGYDMSLLQDALTQMFYIEHPAFLEREVGIVIQAMREGESGIGGAFKSRAFTRTNTDISGIIPTGGNYNSPLPINSTVGTETIVWSDGIPQGTAKLWSTVRTFYQDSTDSSWSNPAQETDTATLDIEFSPSATKPSAPSGNTPFADHRSEGWYDPSNLPSDQTMIWRAERKVSNGVFVGDWVITRIYGEKGNNGGNTATVMLYKRLAEEPQSWQMPTIKLWYDFEAKKLYTSESGTTEPTRAELGGWSLTIPNDSTDPIFVTAAIAYSASGRDDIETGEWVTPAQYTENGSDGQPGQPGAHGINSAPVFLYQRYAPTTQAPTPEKPQVTLYYKFADGQLYTKNGNVYTLATKDDRNNWELIIPASNGNPCYVIQAAALNAEDYDAIEVTQSKDDWSSIRKLVEDGKDGNSVTYDEQGSSIGYAYSSMGSPETGRAYPSDITSWSSTIPAVQKGEYLWRRDITAYKNSDGSSAGTTTTYGVEYQPNDGKSVEIDTNRTFIKYCKQTSSQYTGQHPDDNQFSTIYPTNLAKGEYLWILNQVAYVGVTDALKSYSVSMLGTDGNNGDPGADGYTTHFAYAILLQELPTGGVVTEQNWQTYLSDFHTTNFDGATAIGSYRQKNEKDGSTDDDSQHPWDYVWTQWKGDKGDNGRGITNTNIYYKADSSTPANPSGNPTGTGWSDDGNSLITDTNADKHLYESTCTTYSDGTYSWTTPVDDGLISDMAATSEEFALSDSSTTAPTSGWSTSVTPTAGKWIWSRTVLTFRNGNKKYVNTQCVGYTGINGTDGADLGENLIDKSKGAHVFNVNDRTGNPRYFDTAMRYTPARIPSGTYSGQMVVTTKNCNYGAGAKVRLLIKTTATSGAITQTFVDSGVITTDGTYEVKCPNITLNPQNQTWSGIVILALDNFGNGGTVTIERVKLETGALCSAWCLSENDKIGPAGQDGQNGQNGADGNGIVSETSTFNISRNGTSANENTPPSNLYYQNWQTQQVEPTLDYPFIWQKKVTEYTQSATTTKYYCNGRRGNNGQDGQSIKGDTGPMYFMQGEWSSSTTYTRTSELIPLVFYSNGNDWNTALDCYGHYYYLNADSASGSDVPGTSSKWVQCDEFAVVITRGLFAQFAKLGAFVISGHWMFSQEGTINGSASTDYRQFDPNHPNDNVTTNFIPTYAVDGYTGKVYMNDAYVRGQIEADSGHIGGFKIGQSTISDDNSTPTFTLDSTNNKMIVGNIEVRSQQNFLQNREPNYDWSGLATKSGYDNVTALGARHFINSGENGGHLRLNSSNGGVVDVLTGGNTPQSLLRMGIGMNNLRVLINGGLANDTQDANLASIEVKTTNRSGSDAKSTVIKPNGITTPRILVSDSIRINPDRIYSLSVAIETEPLRGYYQMIIFTGNDGTIRLGSTVENGTMTIIKKTTESGWLIVQNGNGGQIGKIDNGTIMCVYDNGWK